MLTVRRFSILSILLLLIFTGCGYEVNVYKKANDVRVKELDAGRCARLVTRINKDRKSPSGVSVESDYFRIQESGDTIKAELGAQFGVEYIVISDNRGYVPIKTVWTFPKEIENDKGKKFKQVSYRYSRLSHQRLSESYRIDKEFLVVKGEWKLELFFKGRVILEKIFYLV